MIQRIHVPFHTATSELSWFEQTFLDYISDDQLMVPRCSMSKAWLPLTARPEVPQCVEWVAASGAAELYSFVRYHRQYSSDFPVSYQVALVELREGLRLVSSVDVGDAVQLKIGMPLKAVFARRGHLSFIPQP
ncbi:Zn-ribbon domain-containing OB-fold protein [Paraburkholderia caribensis]|uniref:Zn-ribbon domain-containing OB-fold protein n=1 Tax=Paraburkholderia caribensis TaxID=75105 RepID=UPI001CB54472|nr:OB-fold domain-containing protein [Paraburkholderia caribensis]CAG9263084.1 Putative nucleic-acid-binding protein containing a Zn-ribbon [Paraburkholderia caribensis]